MNEMPQMPIMSSEENVQVTETTVDNTQVTETIPASLDEPSHDEIEKPKFTSSEQTISNKLENVKTPRTGIEVVALRKGFYNQNRIRVGDKFKVGKMTQLGEWMRCTDPEIEKQRVEILKKKRMARK